MSHDTQPVSFRMKTKDLERLKLVAAVQGSTATEVILTALTEHLSWLLDSDEFQAKAEAHIEKTRAMLWEKP